MRSTLRRSDPRLRLRQKPWLLRRMWLGTACGSRSAGRAPVDDAPELTQLCPARPTH